MSLEKEIDNINEKTKTLPLSRILPMLLPIALEMSDYEGYCIFTYWSKSKSKNSNSNLKWQKTMRKALLNEKFTTIEIKELEKTTFEVYLQSRGIDESNDFYLCAKEMEDRINYYNELLNIEEPQQQISSLEAVYRMNWEKNQKEKIIKKRTQVEQQYLVLQSYITSKLVEYRINNVVRERKKGMKKELNNSKNIFIIHGHNEAKRRELVTLLKDNFSLNPIVLSDKPDQGMTIIEKFEKYASDCSYAFALFTPDDIVTNGDTQYFQARPNVIFELGWFYSNLGRSRVCILDQASEQSKIFSDLQGVLRMQFNENVSEKYMEIERELKSLGII